MSLPSPVIPAIIVGVVAFNLILLVSWCMIKRRRAKMKRRLIQAAYVNSNPWLAQLNAAAGYNPWEPSTTKGSRHGTIPLTPSKRRPSLANSQGSMTRLLGNSWQPSHHPNFPESFYITTSDVDASRSASILRISPTRSLSPLSASFININVPNAYAFETDSQLAYEPPSPSDPMDDQQLPSPSQPSTRYKRSSSPLPELEAPAPDTHLRWRADQTRGSAPYHHHPYRPTSDLSSITSVPFFSDFPGPLVTSQMLDAPSPRDNFSMASIGNSYRPGAPSQYPFSLPSPPPRAAAPFPLVPRRRVSSVFSPKGIPNSLASLRSGGPYRSSMGDF